jgi:hypothetical protein
MSRGTRGPEPGEGQSQERARARVSARASNAAHLGSKPQITVGLERLCVLGVHVKIVQEAVVYTIGNTVRKELLLLLVSQLREYHALDHRLCDRQVVLAQNRDLLVHLRLEVPVQLASRAGLRRRLARRELGLLAQRARRGEHAHSRQLRLRILWRDLALFDLRGHLLGALPEHPPLAVLAVRDRVAVAVCLALQPGSKRRLLGSSCRRWCGGGRLRLRRQRCDEGLPRWSLGVAFELQPRPVQGRVWRALGLGCCAQRRTIRDSLKRTRQTLLRLCPSSLPRSCIVDILGPAKRGFL